MKKILIYSNMSPSVEMKYAGVFVKNQYDFLSKNDKNNTYSIFALKLTFTSLFGSIKKYLEFVLESYRYIKKGEFDIIHLHYFFPLAFIPWMFKRKKGTKIIATVHGSDLYAKMRNPIIKKIYGYILKDYDYILCVGKQLGEDFNKILGFKANGILCAGIDKAVFRPLPVEKKFDFIFVGSLIERKGFDIVLKVIEATVQDGYKWCVIGTGVFGNDVKALSIKYSNCTYFERLDQVELNVFYNHSKWMFFPSRNEPFGLVASESIFAGTPVISSDSGGLSEQVVDGVNGYILNDSENVEECVRQLQVAYSLSNTKYEDFVTNCGITNVEFSLEYVSNSLRELYNNI